VPLHLPGSNLPWETTVPAFVFVLFLTLPIVAAFFVDADIFVLFLILFCVVGGLCTSGSDPLASSHREEVGRKPAPCGVRDGNRGIIAR
jgi:hypothetical protein